MGQNSKIEWTDHTFNAVVGCTKVSAACDFCYAESWAKRTGHPELWNGERRRTSEANWKQPLKWSEAARQAGERHRVFCCSLSDVFDNQWEPEWRGDLWDLIANCRDLDWLLLTKRPQNIAKMLPPGWRNDGPWPHVWLGTTVENQEEADRRIPHLLAVPARVHFLSCEPLLGSIDLTRALFRCHAGRDGDCTWGRCPQLRDDEPKRTGRHCPIDDEEHPVEGESWPRVDWVICGGESGPHARSMRPQWARSLRDQCTAAGVAFHFKQWGEYAPNWLNDDNGNKIPGSEWIDRMGKKSAGRLLDGVEHNGFPA